MLNRTRPRVSAPRIVGIIALIAVTGIALSGCAAGATSAEKPKPTGIVEDAAWQKIIHAANAEGQVTVYSNQAGTDTLWKSEFEAAYPHITVTIVRQTSGALIARLDQELAAGVSGADVAFHGEGPWFDQRSADGSLAKLVIAPENVKAYGKFKGAYYAPIARVSWNFGYNTKLAAKVSTLKELVDYAEAHKVTIGLTNSPTISLLDQYKRWEAAYPGILERIARLPHTLFPSGVPLSQSLAAGEVGLGVGLASGIVTPLANSGAPIAEVVPTDGLITATELSAAALSKAAHPNAATVFVNWLMTRDAQAALVKKLPPLSTYLVNAKDFNFDSAKTYDPAKWKPQAVQAWKDNWNKIFGNS
jgi:iron(III) transport system substrate-binding protein